MENLCSPSSIIKEKKLAAYLCKERLTIELVSNRQVCKKVNTCDLFHKRRPNCCLSPSWCIMCKMKGESADHLFVHCPVAQSLWYPLFREAGVSHVIPEGCHSLLSERLAAFGRGEKARLLWASVLSYFKDLSLSIISLDWKAALG